MDESGSQQLPSDRGRILVTGGAGFIGANLVRLLLDHGYSMDVVDNLSAGLAEYLEGLPSKFVKGDILDRNAMKSLIHRCDAVVHLAAQTGVQGSLRDPFKDCEANVFGTLNLLEACRTELAERREGSNRGGRPGLRSGQLGPRFIFASSNAPLGRQTPPANEDKAPLPVSPYGASKLAGEAYCLAYHGSWGLETVALRFGNVYGPFSMHKNSVVAKFFKDVVLGDCLIVEGDGDQTRDFIFVGDLCHAILCAIESELSGEIFQIATGQETSIAALANLVIKATAREVKVENGPRRQGDVRRSYAEVSKAQRLLGWEPKTDLVTGLRETWKWFSCQQTNGKGSFLPEAAWKKTCPIEEGGEP